MSYLINEILCLVKDGRKTKFARQPRSRRDVAKAVDFLQSLLQKYTSEAQWNDAFNPVKELKPTKEPPTIDGELQDLVNFWCQSTGRDSVNLPTIRVVFSYIGEFGAEVVKNWVSKAATVVRGGDDEMGRYISGIRRHWDKEAGK